MSDSEFALFQSLVLREAGIHLPETKRALLAGRLAGRLRALELATYRQYYQHVLSAGDGELIRMLDCICTNETHFFREPNHFSMLEERVIPELIARNEAGQGPARVRVWSAGCSTGEEPYSLAMTFLAQLPSGWRIDVLGTDLSTKALGRAQKALWSIEKSHEIPPVYLKRFMLQGVGSQLGLMKARSVLRDIVSFARVNLNEAKLPVSGPFDVVFCRNVLIYLHADRKAHVLSELADRVASGGYLFLGHAESCRGVADLSPIAPTIYSRSEGSEG